MNSTHCFGRRRAPQRPSPARRALLGTLACALLAAPTAAQTPFPGAASPFLPPGHWALEAVRTLHAAGLLPAGVDRASRSLTRLEAGALLVTGFQRAAAERLDLEGLARDYAARFGAEFPELDSRLVGARSGAAFTTGWGDFSYTRAEGRLDPGTYADYDTASWTGPTPRANQTRSRTSLHLTGDLFPHLAVVA
ncbi:MAG TPA: hypothetical protein VMK65_09490, partial [Longimicrobiales bacterium]|nr:hypothetical protein [Longimicrobiales bacterium]